MIVIIGILGLIAILVFVVWHSFEEEKKHPLVEWPAASQNPNANEPDVFASPNADLDPESDTGDPQRRN